MSLTNIILGISVPDYPSRNLPLYSSKQVSVQCYCNYILSTSDEVFVILNILVPYFPE